MAALAAPLASPLGSTLKANPIGTGVPPGTLYINGKPLMINGKYLVISHG